MNFDEVVQTYEDVEWINPKKALAAVKQNGYALQYVKDQTEAICLEAVKQNGLTLKYVKDQTEEICLAAVKQNKDATIYINKEIIDSYIKRLSQAELLTSNSKYLRELGEKEKL